MGRCEDDGFDPEPSACFHRQRATDEVANASPRDPWESSWSSTANAAAISRRWSPASSIGAIGKRNARGFFASLARLQLITASEEIIGNQVEGIGR